MTWQWTSIVPVWVLSIIGAVLVAALSPADEMLTWMPIVFAICILLTFVAQLATQRKEGFVTRVMTSIGGCVAVLVVATGILVVAAV